MMAHSFTLIPRDQSLSLSSRWKYHSWVVTITQHGKIRHKSSDVSQNFTSIGISPGIRLSTSFITWLALSYELLFMYINRIINQVPNLIMGQTSIEVRFCRHFISWGWNVFWTIEITNNRPHGRVLQIPLMGSMWETFRRTGVKLTILHIFPSPKMSLHHCMKVKFFHAHC